MSGFLRRELAEAAEGCPLGSHCPVKARLDAAEAVVEAARKWTYDHEETAESRRCPCSLCRSVRVFDGLTRSGEQGQ